MTIVQKRAAYRVEFRFEEDVLRYSIKDPSGSHAQSVEYEDIGTDYSEMEERRAWFRNAGWLWVIIGLLQLGLKFSKEGTFGFPFWLLIGAGCLGYYYYTGTKFRVYETPRGRVLVMDGKNKDVVLAEIKQRRQAQLKRRYARVINAADPEREQARYEWLAKIGVITAEEQEALLVELRLAIADKMHARKET